MIKFVMCLTRHPKMTREEFRDYWEKKHGPFFMENAGKMGAKKYVQSHTVDTPLSSPEGQELGEALLKDEQNFIDHSKSSAFIVEEVEF